MDDATTSRRARGTGVRHAYETLRDEILTLALEPGAPLDETSLAERFGMSRSPLREALVRLSGEGLVVAFANRPAIVAPIDVAGFPRYVEALDVAQRMNTRLAALQRTDDDLAAIADRQRAFEAAAATGDHLAMSGANRDFHMAIAAAGRNPWLAGFYGRLLDQGRRILHLHFDSIERTRDGYLLTGEHDLMLEAIRARDADRADALAHAHTRQFRDRFVDALSRNLLERAPLGDPPG